MRNHEIRQFMINEMVDVGELIPKGLDYYEDMGGHILHESNLGPYIENFLKNLPREERNDLLKRMNS